MGQEFAFLTCFYVIPGVPEDTLSNRLSHSPWGFRVDLSREGISSRCVQWFAGSGWSSWRLKTLAKATTNIKSVQD